MDLKPGQSSKQKATRAHASFESHLLRWGFSFPLVPYEEHLVVADRRKTVGARVVPDNILNNIGMALERRNGVYGLRHAARFSLFQSRHTRARQQKL